MVTALLVLAWVVPVALYWLLRSRAGMGGWMAAAMAVAAGWTLNLGWAVAAHESLLIAGAFGWFCPAVLVAVPALAWRYLRRAPRET